MNNVRRFPVERARPPVPPTLAEVKQRIGVVRYAPLEEPAAAAREALDSGDPVRIEAALSELLRVLPDPRSL